MYCEYLEKDVACSGCCDKCSEKWIFDNGGYDELASVQAQDNEEWKLLHSDATEWNCEESTESEDEIVDPYYFSDGMHW